MIILVDQDDTIADFNGEFVARWRRLHPDCECVPTEAQTKFSIIDNYPPELHKAIQEVYLAPGFIEGLPPVPGAVEALKAMVLAGHDVFICTSPMFKYEHCVLEKYRWVEKHLGPSFVQKIILTRDKTLVTGDVLIDDKPEIKGLRAPTWTRIIFDAPYNKSVTGPRLTSWSDWQSVVEEAVKEKK